MIVRIKHTWYKGRQYDLCVPSDREEFLHDMSAVVQFAHAALVELVAGDVGD